MTCSVRFEQVWAHLEIGRREDPSAHSKENDGQDGVGAGAEERLGTPQGLAIHHFVWLKT